MKKGFTIIELMVVIAIIGIIASVAIPMYADYSKKAKVSEVPMTIKGIAQLQISWKEDPLSGSGYAADLITLGWSTSNGTQQGNYYEFGTNGVEDCDPGTAAALTPIGLAEAVALNFSEVLTNNLSACMDSKSDLFWNIP